MINARAGDDVVEARGGDNVVDGGAGWDKAAFRGAKADYAITQQGQWTVVDDLTGRDGVTRLINVESLLFLNEGAGPPELQDLVANQAPTAGPVAFDGREDAPLIVSTEQITAGARDPDGDALTLVSVSAPSGGSVALDQAGRVTFTPEPDRVGAAGFDYTIVDAGGLQATGRVDVTLAPVDDAPVAADDVAQAAEDAPILLAAADLLANDRDVDGDALSIIAASASIGAATITAEGDIALDTPTDFFGEATVDYIISDGTTTDTARVVVAVAPVNDAPIAAPDRYLALNGALFAIETEMLLENDFDLEFDALNVIAVSNAVGGSIASFGGGGVRFQIDRGRATASFDYTLSDGAATSEATVTLTVVASDGSPPTIGVPLADQFSPEDAAVRFAPPADAFVDPDGDPLTLSAALAAGAPLPDWLAFDGVAFGGTPPLNFNGTLEIEVTASDGGSSASQSFTLEITPVNDDPIVAGPVTLALTEGATPVSLDLLADATDVDGDALRVAGFPAALPAGVTRIGASLTVDPSDPAYAGLGAGESVVETFSYRIEDGGGGGVDQTATVEILGRDAGGFGGAVDLVEASGDSVIAPLFDGAVIDIGAQPNETLSLAVYVDDPAYSGATQLTLTEVTALGAPGEIVGSRVETVEPYALFGDKLGDFAPGRGLQDGAYRLDVVFYESRDASGPITETLSLDFAIESDAPEPPAPTVELFFVDADADIELGSATVDGGRLTFDAGDVDALGLAARPIDGARDIARVALALYDEDGLVAQRTEKAAPYALFGDDRSDGDFFGGPPLSPGLYVLEVDVFSRDGDLASQSFEFELL